MAPKKAGGKPAAKAVVGSKKKIAKATRKAAAKAVVVPTPAVAAPTAPVSVRGPGSRAAV